MKEKYKIKKKPNSLCRIIEDGKGCDGDAKNRGLCLLHHNRFFASGDLESYGAKGKYKPFDVKDFKLNKKPKDGACCLIDSGVNCSRRAGKNGACNFHTLKLRRHGALEKFNLVPKKTIFTINKKAAKGFCKVKENGKGCQRVINAKGVCSRHYQRSKIDNALAKLLK